jgi:hypothetical protein
MTDRNHKVLKEIRSMRPTGEQSHLRANASAWKSFHRVCKDHFDSETSPELIDIVPELQSIRDDHLSSAVHRSQGVPTITVDLVNAPHSGFT